MLCRQYKSKNFQSNRKALIYLRYPESGGLILTNILFKPYKVPSSFKMPSDLKCASVRSSFLKDDLPKTSSTG